MVDFMQEKPRNNCVLNCFIEIFYEIKKDQLIAAYDDMLIKDLSIIDIRYNTILSLS